MQYTGKLATWIIFLPESKVFVCLFVFFFRNFLFSNFWYYYKTKKCNHFYIIDREQFLLFFRFQGEGSARVDDARGHFRFTRLSLDELRKLGKGETAGSLRQSFTYRLIKEWNSWNRSFNFFVLPSKWKWSVTNCIADWSNVISTERVNVPRDFLGRLAII